MATSPAPAPTPAAPAEKKPPSHVPPSGGFEPGQGSTPDPDLDVNARTHKDKKAKA